MLLLLVAALALCFLLPKYVPFPLFPGLQSSIPFNSSKLILIKLTYAVQAVL